MLVSSPHSNACNSSSPGEKLLTHSMGESRSHCGEAMHHSRSMWQQEGSAVLGVSQLHHCMVTAPTVNSRDPCPRSLQQEVSGKTLAPHYNIVLPEKGPWLAPQQMDLGQLLKREMPSFLFLSCSPGSLCQCDLPGEPLSAPRTCPSCCHSYKTSILDSCPIALLQFQASLNSAFSRLLCPSGVLLLGGCSLTPMGGFLSPGSLEEGMGLFWRAPWDCFIWVSISAPHFLAEN